ncbi:MAG: alkaline phosphatase family protein, partial [Armatimonadetes bacterium]|nr:alkaline phosphatase family protein [Armatimonadota bacterium]
MRAVVLGLDAMVPNVVERLLAEGELPHLRRLLEEGCFTRLRPVIPPQTPTNWTTLATGATPGGHGVVQWGSHRPGEPVWEYHREEAFNAGLCRAEYLWEAAARAGKRSVVMNYAGYPPTTDAACFIDRLFQPSRSYYDLAPATVYHNCREWATTDPLLLGPAAGWANLPIGGRLPLAGRLPVAPSTGGQGPVYHVLVWSLGDDYDNVSLFATQDAGEPFCHLTEGEWSPWLRAPFRTPDQGECEGAFRLKLVELARNGSRVRLFRTDAFPTDGRLCSDGAVGRRLMAELGPYVHSTQTCHLHCRGVLDWATQEEVMEAEAAWWSGAAEIAMEDTEAS